MPTRWPLWLRSALGPVCREATTLVAEVDGGAVSTIAFTSGAVAAGLDRARPLTVQSLRYRRQQFLRQGGDTGQARTCFAVSPPARRVLQERVA